MNTHLAAAARDASKSMLHQMQSGTQKVHTTQELDTRPQTNTKNKADRKSFSTFDKRSVILCAFDVVLNRILVSCFA